MVASKPSRAPNTNTFTKKVFDLFNMPLAGVEFSYFDYLDLPANSCFNDEADFVDPPLIQAVVAGLGFLLLENCVEQ